jgi:hypothetical protein
MQSYGISFMHPYKLVAGIAQSVYRLLGRDSSVGIATRYGLDVPGIESRRGRDFPHPSRPALGPTQTGPRAHPASYTMGIVSLSGVKRPGRGVDHRLPSSTEVKESVELYLYSTSGPSWPVLEWPLPLSYPTIDQTAYMDAWKKYYKTACTSLPDEGHLDVRNMSKAL